MEVEGTLFVPGPVDVFPLQLLPAAAERSRFSADQPAVLRKSTGGGDHDLHVGRARGLEQHVELVLRVPAGERVAETGGHPLRLSVFEKFHGVVDEVGTVVVELTAAVPAAGLPVPAPGEPGPADADISQVAEDPAAADLPDLLKILLEPALLEGLEDPSGLFRRGDHGVHVGRGVAERLFAEDVLPREKRLFGQNGVGAVVTCHDHQLHAGVGDHLLRGSAGFGEGELFVTAAFRQQVADGGDGELLRNVRDGVGVDAAAASAETDDADSDRVHDEDLLWKRIVESQ